MSEIILFDLDGTLTDSAPGITRCVQYALRHFGIDEPDLKKLESFVGPPLKEMFMEYDSVKVRRRKRLRNIGNAIRKKEFLRMRFTRESLSCFSYAGTGDECLASRPPNRRCLLSRS